jgi:hypothetical protein
LLSNNEIKNLMFLNCQSVVAKILQKNINFSYCCIVLHYHYDHHAWLPRFKKYCPAGIGLLYPFCFKKLKIGFLDFLGLPDATVFFFVLAIFKHPVYIFV